MDDLLKYCKTPRQEEVIRALSETGGAVRPAARLLGCDHATVIRHRDQVKALAESKGWSPEHNMTQPLPDLFNAKRISSYYNRDGQVTGQWVIGEIDREKHLDLIKSIIAGIAEDLPRLAPTDPPKGSSADLCNQFTFTDYHLGMLAWAEEGGADWNLGIATTMLIKAFQRMTLSAPVADKAVVLQLGDFLHSDGPWPVTPTSGHVLDQSARYGQIVRAAIRCCRFMVQEALRRHREVHVIMAQGNHDLSGAIWLAELLAALYEQEPRVHVETSPSPYYALKHGLTMIGAHHGHKKPNKDLPLLMASRFPEIWGATKYRYVHSGHLHHFEEKEHNGIRVIRHQTLAAADSHSSHGGYDSERGADRITYSARFGRVETADVRPEMFSV